MKPRSQSFTKLLVLTIASASLLLVPVFAGNGKSASSSAYSEKNKKQGSGDAQRPCHNLHNARTSYVHTCSISWGGGGDAQKPQKVHYKGTSYTPPPDNPGRSARSIQPPVHRRGVSRAHTPRLSWEEGRR